MIRVLIAAPTPARRAGLRALAATNELQIAGETATLALLDATDGSIERGTHAALLAQQGFYTRLYASQCRNASNEFDATIGNALKHVVH
jgi:hypothetical protein